MHLVQFQQFTFQESAGGFYITTPNRTPLALHPMSIQRVEPHKDGNLTVTRITTTEGDTFLVNESYESTLGAIDAALKA